MVENLFSSGKLVGFYSFWLHVLVWLVSLVTSDVTRLVFYSLIYPGVDL